MLTGSELIAKTKELKGVSESERVLACGYFSTSKNGKKRLNFNAYYKAIAIAQGYKSSNENELGGIGKGGRKLSPCNKCNADGTLHGVNHANAWASKKKSIINEKCLATENRQWFMGNG